MRWFYTLPLRIKALFRRSKVESELDEELRYHLDRQTEANVAAGMPAAEAQRAALLSLGGMALRKEECRDALGWWMLDAVLRDCRHALRGLIRNPGFAATAILVLAMATGASTAIFSVFEALVLHPLPYDEPEQLVGITENFTKFDITGMQLAALELDDLRAMTGSFSQIGGIASGEFALTAGGAAEGVSGLRISASVFPMLNVKPILGSPFRREDEEHGKHRVVVISEGLWRRRFGADPNIVGTSIEINREPYRVAAVSRPILNYLRTAWDLWVPLSFPDREKTPQSRGAKAVDVIARMKPGITVARAEQDLAAVTARLTALYPGVYSNGAGFSLHATELTSMVAGELRRPLLFLLAAAGMLMLIACVNVSSLLLARGSARKREVGLRAALGAGRWRVMWQLMTESMAIAALSGALGVAVGHALLKLFETYGRSELIGIADIEINVWVLAFATGISSAASLLFGLVPAFTASAGVSETLKESGRGATAARRGLRETMVGLEVAASLILLLSSGLLIRSFLRVQQADPGFNERNVLTFELLLPAAPYGDSGKRIAFYEAFRSRIQYLPGVAAVGAASRIPFGGVQGGSPLQVVGRPVDPKASQPMLRPSRILPGYFESLGIPLLKGRFFTPADTAGGLPVAIIDQATALRYFPDGEDPIGRQVTGGEPGLTATIVGVVGSVKRKDLSEPAEMSVYHAGTQKAGGSMTFTVKTAADPLALIPAIRHELAQLDPFLPLTRIVTMEQRLSDSLARRRLTVQLMLFFGLAALLLTATGLYGVLSHAVIQRRREVGVLIAVGARPTQVVAFVAKQAVLPVGLGIAAGLGGAIAATRLVSAEIYEISPNDPVIYASVTGLLVAAAAAAIAIPARRAATIDPAIALRQD